LVLPFFLHNRKIKFPSFPIFVFSIFAFCCLRFFKFVCWFRIWSGEHKTCAYSRAETLTISKLNCLHDHAEKHRQWCCDVVHTGENHLETLRLLGSRLKDAQGVRRFFPLNHS
jgi:hypothetical protein